MIHAEIVLGEDPVGNFEASKVIESSMPSK
jgi:hypothetical protein